MNKHLSIVVFLAIVSSALWSCNGQKTTEKPSRATSKVERINLIKAEKPINGTLYSQGDIVELELSLVNDTIQPDSIILFFDKERISSIENLNKQINTGTASLGNKQIRATAWLNGNRQSASVGIKIKANKPPQKLRYRVLNTYPHDIKAYTQGLFYHDGYLIESTGQKGQSSLRRVELETGKVIQSVNLDRQYFGEGTTLYDNKIYQITWTSRKGFVYNADDFTLIRTFDYLTQGWGLTTVDDKLVMSDGSNTLYFLEPQTFAEQHRIEVYDNEGPVSKLNELEYINGKIYANIYLAEKIVVINPNTGMVEAEVDFSGLLTEQDNHRNIDVFNGIAWDEENQQFFVTGKNWPKLYVVEIY